MHTFWVIFGVYLGIGGVCFVVLSLVNLMMVGGIIFTAPLKALFFCLLLWPIGLLMLMTAMDEEY